MSRQRPMPTYTERMWQRVAGPRRLIAMATASGMEFRTPVESNSEWTPVSQSGPVKLMLCQPGKIRPVADIPVVIWENDAAVGAEHLDLASVGILSRHASQLSFSLVMGALNACRMEDPGSLCWLRWGAIIFEVNGNPDPTQVAPWLRDFTRNLDAETRGHLQWALKGLGAQGWRPDRIGSDGICTHIRLTMQESAPEMQSALQNIWMVCHGLHAAIHLNNDGQWTLDILLHAATPYDADVGPVSETLVYLPPTIWRARIPQPDLRETG